MTGNYITISELAKLACRSPQRIHQIIQEGKLPALWIGNQRVVRRAEALAFCERCAELDGRSQLTLLDAPEIANYIEGPAA